MADEIRVEVVFATATRQELIELTIDEPATVADAIEKSGIQGRFPDTPLQSLETGIWGKPADRGQRLQEGDRVEIYRPLERDPRDARRELARDQSRGSSS